ncbi:MAG TPA: hypothetical protein VEQ63_09215, partial [Bryobacteraceae bacterium]|nr:hypothetical protein [Bryobacteraceae bacterium]
WTVAFGESGVFHGGHSLSAGVIAHKIPECLAFGVILRAAMRSKTIALASARGVQAATLAGALLQQTTSHWVSPSGVAMLLVFGGATFLYLGFHSLHGEWKRRTASATT